MKASPGYQLGKALALKTAGLLYTTDSERMENRMKGLMAGQAAAIGTGLAGMGLALGGVGLEGALTKAPAREALEKALPEVMHLPKDVEISHLMDSALQSHFDPMERVIRTSAPISPGILSHEMGHASGLAAKRPLWHAIPIGGKMLGMPVAAASLIAQAYTDPGSTATKAWRYAPAALMTPTILEEIRASSRALRGLYRAGGKGAMLKGLLPLLPALGTYLAAAGLPIFGGKIVQHYSSR